MKKRISFKPPHRRLLTLLFLILGLTAICILWQYRQQAAFAESLSSTPDPEVCAVCGGARYHAPCLVDLSTGEVGELTVYDPHRSLMGEIEETQPTGTFSLVPCAGLTAARDTCNRTCTVTLPKEQDNMAPVFFCRDCRNLLAETAQRGYVLLDLYDLQDIAAYPVNAGAEYEIRDYAVSIQRSKGSQGLSVIVQGRLFLI